MCAMAFSFLARDGNASCIGAVRRLISHCVVESFRGRCFPPIIHDDGSVSHKIRPHGGKSVLSDEIDISQEMDWYERPYLSPTTCMW